MICVYNIASVKRFFWLIAGLGALIPAVSRGDWAFVHPRDDFKASAMLDLRCLNERTAGQCGFVHLSPTGDFVRGDGTPIRFWGCGTAEYTLSADELADHARFLAKLGVNMVRIHAQIGPDSEANSPALTDVNQKEIDAIWRAVAAFKKEGIYVTISPYWAIDRPAEGWGIDGYKQRGNLWGLLFFDPKLQEGYKAWVRKLYAEKNPYTGIPLARDPAVAIIQVQNEDGMFFWTMDGMKPEEKRALGRKFGAWLVQKYGSIEDTADAWKDKMFPGDDFKAGDVAILSVGLWARPQSAGLSRRLDDQLEFFAETQRAFYAGIVKFYRVELGCGQLINASNWITADPVHLNDVERYTDCAADVLAVNKYFTGIHDGKNSGWRIDPGDHFTNQPAVLNPWDLPTNLKLVVGHPMIVTETTWVSPMDFQNEGPFLAAAYESLTGVAACDWFTATASEYEDDPRLTFLDLNAQHALRKWTCSTPNIMGNFPAAAMMYRSGYVQRGQPVVVENRPLSDLWKRRIPIISEDPTFDPNRNAGEPGARVGSEVGVNPMAFLVGPVTVNYGGDPAKNFTDNLSSFIDLKQKTITSETGQIHMNYGQGICTIDSPAAQGVSGFLRAAGKISLSTVDIICRNRQASILVVSMDGKPLSESRRMLVQVGTPARLSGWSEQGTDFEGKDHKTYHGFVIKNIGSPPWMVESADLELTIRNACLCKMSVLDSSGYVTKQISLSADTAGGSVHFPDKTMYAIIETPN
jgi:hypothetical protein